MKGQSAVEYIMTYGWAILALVIVTGALLASGVISPNYLISEECNLGSNFPCKAAVYNEGMETKISIDVYNGFPYEIEIKEMNIGLRDENLYFGVFDMNEKIESGGNHNYQGTLGTLLQENAIKRFNANITYVSCAPEISEEDECSTSEHTVSGKIVARVLSE